MNRKVDDAKAEKCLPNTNRGRSLEVIHHPVGERCADHRTAAETHDGHPGRHAATIGEPFDQRRNRRNIAETEPNAADHPGSEPQDPKLVNVDPKRTEKQAAGPTERRDDPGFARSRALQPSAPNGGRYAEDDEEQCEHPAHAGDAPVAGGREELGHDGDIGAGF